MTAAAAAMSCNEAHSRTEWYACPPVKMFGVGRPIALSREPSVPPRIGSRSGWRPSARERRDRVLDHLRERLEVRAHVRVLLDDVDRHRRARRRARPPPRAVRPHELGVAGELVVVEVAQDHPDARRAGVAGQLVDVDEALAARRRLGRQASCGSAATISRRDARGVDEDPRGEAGWTSTPVIVIVASAPRTSRPGSRRATSRPSCTRSARRTPRRRTASRPRRSPRRA